MHWDVAPIACGNFATFCTNGSGTLESNTKANTSISGNKIRPAPIDDCGKHLSYQNYVVHCIVLLLPSDEQRKVTTRYDSKAGIGMDATENFVTDYSSHSQND
jgi:hypothetical protein